MNEMCKIFVLTEIDKNNSHVLNTAGRINQWYYSTIKDVLYHLFVNYDSMSIKNIGGSGLRFFVTATNGDKTVYYELKEVEPINLEKSECSIEN